MTRPPAPRTEIDLAALLEAGRAAWPDLDLAPAVFAEYVAERAPSCAPAHAGDVYLACACVRAVPGAVEAFERAFRDVIARALARYGLVGAAADDIAQALRVRLFVADEGPPKISEYGGRAALATWLTIVSARAALMARRAATRKREDDSIGDEFSGGLTPEMLLMKQRHAKDFAAALGVAFDGLSDQERTVLRLHVVERLTIDALGDLYRVGRSTAARWIRAARVTLIDATRRELRERLQLTESEYGSLAALVQSQLDAEVHDLLERRK